MIPRWCILMLVAAAVVVRVEAVHRCWGELRNDPDGYAELAEGLQRSGEFSLRGKAAYRPPLYPVVLALVAPQGTDDWSLTVGILQVVFGLVTIALVYALARRWQLSPAAAAVAALVVTIDPILLRQSTVVMTETLATLLAAVALWACTAADERRNSGRFAAFAGIALGLCVLTRPTFLVWAIFVLLWCLFAIWRKRWTTRWVLCGALGFAVAVVPWAIRNWTVRDLQSPILTTTHGGYTLYRANNPDYYGHVRSTRWGAVWDSTEFDRAWNRELAALSERESDARASKRAYAAMQAEPVSFMVSCAARLERLYGLVPWRIDPHESWRTRWLRYGVGAFYMFELSLVLVGAVTLGRQLLAPPWLWGTLLLLAFTLVHTFYWTDMRMRAPLVPVMAMMAAVGAERVGKRAVESWASRDA